ncbi:unnamed protein product, partial [Meganyctiphanes norvegica]
DKSECTICNNIFDIEIHRPRVLPCGHGFCTQCIETCIQGGNKACPTCREKHRAKSATDLPVCYILEELIHTAAISSYHETDLDSFIGMDSVDMCPKHKGVPLHFYCRSHNTKVCHSCAVIDHPPKECNLIPLDVIIKEKKQSQITTVQKHKKALMDSEKDIKMILQWTNEYLMEKQNQKQDFEKEVDLLFTKIEQINQEILNKNKIQEMLNDSIKDCQKKQKMLEIMDTNLKAAISNCDIEKECEKTAKEIMQNQKWDESMRNALSVRKDQYAQVTRDGTCRSCQTLKVGRRTYIGNFSKEVKPPSSAKLIQEDDLGLVSSTSTVWMDLSAHGSFLGRVHIRVMGNRPHGQQFLMLALGINGPTIMGAIFCYKDSYLIALRNYGTENGTLSNEPLLKKLKMEHTEKLLPGRLFTAYNVNSASFRIITKSWEGETHPGYFGDVITGMEVIKIAASGEYDIRDIAISECGIVLDF